MLCKHAISQGQLSQNCLWCRDGLWHFLLNLVSVQVLKDSQDFEQCNTFQNGRHLSIKKPFFNDDALVNFDCYWSLKLFATCEKSIFVLTLEENRKLMIILWLSIWGRREDNESLYKVLCCNKSRQDLTSWYKTYFYDQWNFLHLLFLFCVENEC